MKIIEALKKVKDLQRKKDDIKTKVATYHVDYDYETPVYGDRQKEQIEEWIQAHSDILKEIERLRVAIQKTNLAIQVTIELGGKAVSKTIAQWIHRRRDLATEECSIWKVLNDKGLKEIAKATTTTGESKDVKIRRYYSPQERDQKIEVYRSEPTIIDSTLEVINAVTDLIEE